MKLKKVGLGDGGTRWAVDHNDQPLDGKFYRTEADAQAAMEKAMAEQRAAALKREADEAPRYWPPIPEGKP